jgi:hypothetical protein
MRAWEILAEVGAVKPVKPLTPAKARTRAAKQVKVQQQVQDQNHRHADKERDLKARMA